MGLFRREIESRPGARIVIVAIFCLALASSSRANAPLPVSQPSKILPSALGDFHVIGNAAETRPSTEKDTWGTTTPKSIADALYESSDGVNLRVSLFEWESDAAAYASFTTLRNERAANSELKQETVGTASSLID